MLLDAQGLNVVYGRTHAVKDVSVHVGQGEIVTVLGANGAGKSSLLRALQGMVKPQQGELLFKGQSVLRQSAAWRVGQGLVLVPEGRQIFVSLTVNARRDMLASVLSGGEQQMLAIGRALLSKPALMMLDEPSLGLSPLLVQALFGLLKDLNRDGLSILLVEQNTHMALATAHRAYVLELGRMVLQGNAQDIAADPRMAAAYLGA